MNWEERYQNRDTPWENGEPSPGLADYLSESPLHGRVLVPGCGFGHDVRVIARAGAGKAEVLGVDIAPSALEGARALSLRAASGDHYELADLLALPPHLQGVFDWVWEHTCFCAIDPAMRVRYVTAIAEALKPQGQFLAIFYLNPSLDPGKQGPPFGVSTAELDALFDPRFELLSDWLPKRAFPKRKGRERMRLYARR
jgi:SAM-dependent methyltransferase